jgi:hypothetical protein
VTPIHEQPLRAGPKRYATPKPIRLSDNSAVSERAVERTRVLLT